MLIRDPETGRAIEEPQDIRAARLAEAAAARTERHERRVIGDQVWAGIGAAAVGQHEITASALEPEAAPTEVIVQLPPDPAATVTAAAELVIAAHASQPA